jgi:hydrogenase nickel incorporation protein HypA/HybF
LHELSLTMELVDVALERARGARVRRVRVAVGALAAVVPESMRFCFDACAKDTLLEGAELEIETLPGRARCRACAAAVTLERPYGECGCGSIDLEILSGDEVLLMEMEV